MNKKKFLLIIFISLCNYINIFATAKEYFINPKDYQSQSISSNTRNTDAVDIVTNYVVITNEVIVSTNYTFEDRTNELKSYRIKTITNTAEEIRKLQVLDYLKNQEKINEQKRVANQKKIITKIETKEKFPQQNHEFIPIDAIVLDAGHGGHDSGGVRNGISEKRLVLTLIKKIHTIFRKKNKGIKIYVTRKNDKFFSLEDRVSKTTKWASKRNILFISIHANIAYNSKVEGIEIYTLSANASDPEALATERIENAGFTKEDIEKTESFYSILADLIRDSTRKQSEWLAKYVYENILQKTKGYGRGLKRANFFVLKYNTVPSILVEVGFMTHPIESQKLKNEEYQNKIAAGIFIGVTKYIKDYNKTEGFIK